ncbi:MAG: response regulator [Chitinophagaceae bacterium]
MKDTAPVFIVDDDLDDWELIKDVWSELGLANELCFFENGHKLLGFLKDDPVVPLLVICDVNIPIINGFELREIILKDPTLNHKSIPFIYWSNKASERQIKKAYDLGVQGFFIKDNQFEDLKRTIQNILEYWKTSKQPLEP